jgi:hypothetical protein
MGTADGLLTACRMRPLRYLDTTQTVTPMRNRTIETEWNSSLASTLTLHERIDISFSSTIATRSAQSPLHPDRPKIEYQSAGHSQKFESLPCPYEQVSARVVQSIFMGYRFTWIL